ncbi:hypothetical protein GCWU000246_00810 [Jonquetella anthropi E3_33 E1]|nr:hypothetical protein GCWU000246_00810 [Jonquetella anthropi E3_33 E1]
MFYCATCAILYRVLFHFWRCLRYMKTCFVAGRSARRRGQVKGACSAALGRPDARGRKLEGADGASRAQAKGRQTTEGGSFGGSLCGGPAGREP